MLDRLRAALQQVRRARPKAQPASGPASAAWRQEPQRHLLSGIAAIAGLSSLALAQPVYDVLRQAPEFFAIRNLYTGDLLALVVVVAVVPTLALSAPVLTVRFLRPSWTRPAIAVPVGLLSGTIGLQAVRGLPAPAAVPLALAAGAIFVWAYLRFRGVRSFASLLFAAAVLVPALLVLDGRVRRSASGPSQAIPADLADTGARAPIVLVVFDEWSLVSILDSDGAIDRQRLPNLARLADRATWYPNATAPADVTELAMPAILTSQKAKPGQLPTLAEHPINLFTLLARSHDIYAIELVTSLCPPDLNRLAANRGSFGERLSLLISDLAVVWLHQTLPDAWTEQLPQITHTWSGFRQDPASTPADPPPDKLIQRAVLHLREADRAAEFRRFADSIEPAGRRPGFYFLHSLLPHMPWEYLPSGRRYRGRGTGIHRFFEEGRWTTDPEPVRHYQKRYLLQVSFVDRLIGELIDKLESLDQFDRSVIVITADHGVAFEPGRQRRRLKLHDHDPLGSQPLDLAAVPLIIKAPFQRQAAVDDSVASLVGLAPRILELAGAGANAAPQQQNPDRLHPVGKHAAGMYRAAEVELPVDREPWRRERLAEQATLLGDANDPIAIGVLPKLHGRRISELRSRSSKIGIRLEDPDLWDDVDLDAPLLPATVQGVLVGPDSLLDRSAAVALNGVVAATVRPHQTRDGKIRLAALLPERLFRPELNEVDVFLIGEEENSLVLEHLRRPPRSVYELASGRPGQDDALVRRSGSAKDSVVQIPVQRRNVGSVAGFVEGAHRADASIRGWATDLDDPGSSLQVVAFLAGRQFWTGATNVERKGVAERYGPEHLHSGFRQRARTATGMDAEAASETLAAIRREGFVVYAVSPQGVASRLRFFYAPLEKENGAEILPISDGRRLIVQPAGHGFGGTIDVVSKLGRRTLIEGWAGGLERGEPPHQIVIYRSGAFLASLEANRERPDVAKHYSDPRLLRTGFQGAVPGTSDPEDFAETHRVFAIMLRGVAVELAIRAAP